MALLEIGLLEGIFHITGMITEVPSGAFADLLGRKKSMVVGRLFLTLSCIVMLFGNSFWIFALGFVLHAWSYNFNSGSEEALVYDSLKLTGEEEKYPKVNGRINFLIEVSQGMATVIGGVLAQISYEWCYLICILIAVLGFLPLIYMVEPRIEKIKHKENNLFREVTMHFRTSLQIVKYDKKIMIIVVYYSVVFAAFTVLLFYSQQFFADHGMSKIQISGIMFVVGIAACGGALSSDWLFTRLRKKLSLIGAFGISLAILAFSLNQMMAAVVALIVAGFCNSMLYPVQSVSLNELIPSQQRATLISLNSMTFSMVMVIVFPLFGGLADAFGLPVIFGGLGILLLGMITMISLGRWTDFRTK